MSAHNKPMLATLLIVELLSAPHAVAQTLPAKPDPILRLLMGECDGTFRQVYGVLRPEADSGRAEFAKAILEDAATFAQQKCPSPKGFSNISVDVRYGVPATFTAEAFELTKGRDRESQYHAIMDTYPERALHARNYRASLAEAVWEEMTYEGPALVERRARATKVAAITVAATAVPKAMGASGDLDYLAGQTRCLGPTSGVGTVITESCDFPPERIRAVLDGDVWTYFAKGAPTPLEKQMRAKSPEVLAWRDSLGKLKKSWENIWWRALATRSTAAISYDLESRTFSLSGSPPDQPYGFQPALGFLRFSVRDLNQAYAIEKYTRGCGILPYALFRLVRPEDAASRGQRNADGADALLMVHAEAIALFARRCHFEDGNEPLIAVIPVRAGGSYGPARIGEQFRSLSKP